DYYCQVYDSSINVLF
nr:immunoglobulin light chain junction region [Macaca mulatta]MOW27364.1 immunoglobulin light chain junction region [Macaca mulatta]MOW27426.1 immunoglobulin light chain junction region [Macaca mulatta]MOW27612.1 immunoglobulin light chain junction region [Macaca mulatta]MOW27640.1 immunoglobulin light chain junction region [Macaca mulatta]